ncbi:probable multidrug resistance-associated protein lethal(2)03659 [Leptinotarsa decemlineata]|uniref:probable multidrug resistance-associated protein lethal(2)03659 n=1 Tax=Leptinotarsa decemlineata TaxID=7539 RepID=UPI003D308DB3
MYTWEKLFTKIVEIARKVLRVAVAQIFPQAITQFAETKVSLKRIQKFLLHDELQKGENIHCFHLMNSIDNKNNLGREPFIELNTFSVKWCNSVSEYTLKNINFKVFTKQLVAVVGPVGGGKSTLLHAILKEFSPEEGTFGIKGSVSYASQEPWLFGASVRQNIVFGQNYDPVKYEEVVRVCALQRDFTLFPHGDRTLVGERGASLSGGQRARINLARAIYRDADIYLLDDPLSAVDVQVAKELFNNCIRGYLRKKCVVLVTHQLYFLKDSDRIYLLEDGTVRASARSPIYTHLAASLQGITTVRAFEAEGILTKEFDNYQDAHSSAYFMFLTANEGFGFWLDLYCVLFVAMVIVSILCIQNETLGGNVGYSLTQSTALTGMFQWGVRQLTELENQMTSAERIQEYTDIVPEQYLDTKEPPKFWPDAGKIEFAEVSFRYSETDPYVLKNLTFRIKPREKVGIVGRTGAGKSTLLQALFRLTDIEGNILIDGVDTKNMPLKTLRSKISIIPQEPVLFSGTLRKNLDPFDEYHDQILWKALNDVELKQVINELPAGLDSKMSEGGSNFSVGQRQLLCLARAIIRNNKILVLDEVTTNVDPQTDALIQSTMKKKFANCTVLTIAHRLHTIMDSDKVLVMDAGELVEFDHPYVLLLNENGVFYGLVKQIGSSIAETLKAIAEKHFTSRS